MQADPRPTSESEVLALFPSWPSECVRFGLRLSTAYFVFTGGPVLKLGVTAKEAIPETVRLATVLNTGLASLITDPTERGLAFRQMVVGEVLHGRGRALLEAVARGQPKKIFDIEFQRCLVKCWRYPDSVRMFYTIAPSEGSGAKRERLMPPTDNLVLVIVAYAVVIDVY